MDRPPAWRCSQPSRRSSPIGRVRSDVGMTGEITLRGLVLPIGGLKEKSLAAMRAGLDTVIIPKLNEKDLVDVPNEAREKLRFVPVENVDGALGFALEDNH